MSVQEQAQKLYSEFVESLDSTKSYSMPEFNISLEAFLVSRSADDLIVDAVFDIKFSHMLDDCDGQIPQHSSW